jgi:prepilin-type N-terminal cleavage/methylation domain-containing protein
MRHAKQEGFTLIELLIVVAIIGILATIASLSYNEYKRQARNARRISDIKTIATALHAGPGENALPEYYDGWACVSASCYGNWSIYTPNSAVDAFIASSLPQKPADPRGGIRASGGYMFQRTTSPTWFAPAVPGAYLLYVLERSVSPSSCGPGKFMYNTTSAAVCALQVD